MGKEFQAIFLGTGTSSTLPALACLTDPVRGCVCCRSTIKGSTLSKDGSKNKRGNTSMVLRVTEEGQDSKTILVDCGKSFYRDALQVFPEKGLRKIDAVLLTHAHADAMNGLDDLRSWTLGGIIQSSIDIYCDQDTFHGVERSFPYLTSKKNITGGGDVPEIKWHVFVHDKPFDVCGIQVTPLPVHHGAYFTEPPKPYYCNGFLFDRSIVYLGDVSYVPESIYETIAALPDLDSLSLVNGHQEKKQLPILIIDALKIIPHSSHYGIGQTMSSICRLNPQRTYILGFAHRISHDCWTYACETLSSKSYSIRKGEPAWPLGNAECKAFERTLHTKIEEDFQAFADACVKETSGWVKEDAKGTKHWLRPAYDGLSLTVKDGKASDEFYGDA